MLNESDKEDDKVRNTVVNADTHILVVDDEKYICEIIRSILSDSEGYRVTATTEPAEALKLVESERVDLVLTDLVMGSYSGVDILKETLKNQPDAIVIFMTGHPTIENVISVLKLGAYDYLVKPFKLETLKVSVERGLEKLRLYRENIHLKDTVSLYEISEAMGSTIHLDSLLNLVLESVVTEFDASMATISLLDEERKELAWRAYHGDLEEIKDIDLLLGSDEINKAVVKSGSPEIIEELFTGFGNNDNGSTSTAICAPLFAKGKVIGTLNIVRASHFHPFATGDLQSLSVIASKAASAIENSRLYDDLETAYLSTIQALANAVEARDLYTRGHTERVTRIAEKMARELGWDEDTVRWLRIGATLHDIGKIGVPDGILNKPGPLSDQEFAIMQQHPALGAKMIDGVQFLQPIVPYILCHHEKWDGTGYPEGLSGEDIPIEGRLLAVADTVDAILSTRPYRQANTLNKVVDELKEFSGRQFDPDLVDLFLGMIESGSIDFESMYADIDHKKEPYSVRAMRTGHPVRAAE